MKQPWNKPGPKRNPVREMNACRDYTANNLSTYEIAARYGIQPATLYEWLHRHHIPLQRKRGPRTTPLHRKRQA